MTKHAELEATLTEFICVHWEESKEPKLARRKAVGDSNCVLPEYEFDTLVLNQREQKMHGIYVFGSGLAELQALPCITSCSSLVPRWPATSASHVRARCVLWSLVAAWLLIHQVRNYFKMEALYFSKCSYIPSCLHGVTTRDVNINTLTAVRSSNPTRRQSSFCSFSRHRKRERNSWPLVTASCCNRAAFFSRRDDGRQLAQ